MECYEDYPTLLEDHFGGSQRAGILAAASACTTGIATGNAQVALSAWYMSMYVHKEGWGRLGFFGYDLQDQCGATNVCSYQGDEGCCLELRGANYPNYAMNVGHQGEYAGFTGAAHAGAHDAYCCNPLVRLLLHQEGVRQGCDANVPTSRRAQSGYTSRRIGDIVAFPFFFFFLYRALARIVCGYVMSQLSSRLPESLLHHAV
jgi:methyl coenzyme M reductase alpha subunit